MTNFVYSVASEAALDADLQAISVGGSDAQIYSDYVIDLAYNTYTLSADLPAINLPAGSTLLIQGGTDSSGHVAMLFGHGAYGGLHILAGTVNLESLDLQALWVTGGAGVAGGGGGAGLGGAVFVGALASVTLTDDQLFNNAAYGGTGGNAARDGGGGGIEGSATAKAGANGTAGLAGGNGGGLNGGMGGGVGGTAGGAGVGAGYDSLLHLGANGGGGGVGGPGGTPTAFGAGGGAGGGGGGGGGASYGLEGTGISRHAPYGGHGGGGGDGGYGSFGGGGGGGGGGGTGGDFAVPLHFGLPGSAMSGGRGGFGAGAGGLSGAGGQGYVYVPGPPGSVHGGYPPYAYSGGGGGGFGAGGSVFVQQGGSLTMIGVNIEGGHVKGGAAGLGGGGSGAPLYVSPSQPGTAGIGAGAGIFVQGNATITLEGTQTEPAYISDPITDQDGAGGIDADHPGTLTVAAIGGPVDLSATNSFSGGLMISGGTVDLMAAGAAGTGTITFTGAPALLRAEVVPTETIDGLTATGTIQLWNVPWEPGAFSVVSNHTLEVISNGTVVPLVVGDIPNGTHLQVFGDGYGFADVTGLVACFAAGTRIATTEGPRAVETLRIGDAVVTLCGAVRPIVWLGHRRVLPLRHRRPVDVLPVRVRAHAFGPGRPGRDVVLSPDHAVYFSGVLIPVRCLVDGHSVVRESVGSVTYWHVELDAHDVILADGLPAESFLDTGNRGAFENGSSAVQLHPDFAARRREAAACAKLVVAGPEVAAARAALGRVGGEDRRDRAL